MNRYIKYTNYVKNVQNSLSLLVGTEKLHELLDEDKLLV